MSLMDVPHIVYRKKTDYDKKFNRLNSDKPPLKVFEGTHFECLKWKHEQENYTKNQGNKYFLVKTSEDRNENHNIQS